MKLLTRPANVGLKLKAGIAIFLLAVACVAAAPAAPAKAAGESCRNYETELNYTMNGYHYSLTRVVPSWSPCRDINVKQMRMPYWPYTATCTWLRVRFYPTSGGSYDNGWRHVCPRDYGDRVIASAVKNGTTYRIESDEINVLLHIYD